METLLHVVINVFIMLGLTIYHCFLAIVRLIVPYKYRAKSIKGEICLVTGAGSGIGKLMAKKFAKLGARMVLIDVNERDNEKTANEILLEGGNAKAFTCDLSKREDIYRIADEVSLIKFKKLFKFI